MWLVFHGSSPLLNQGYRIHLDLELMLLFLALGVLPFFVSAQVGNTRGE